MSTIDELAEGVMDNLNPENFMDEAVKVKITLHMKPVIEALLSQGWRPPMRDICTPTDMKTLISGALVRDREGLFRVLSEPDAVDFENHGPFRVVWEPEQ